jgi:hypothetical protein
MKPDTEMNRSKEQRDAEVMKTMSILDDMPGIKAHHLFRAHLLQRIEAAERPRAVAGGFNPRLAFFGLLLAVNVGMGMLMFTHQEPQTMAAHSGDTADAISEDYGGPALSYYDQQAPEPQNNE